MSKRGNKSTGSLGEKIAAKFLQGKGYYVLDKNYRKPWGEVDIVCEKQGIVHFVEVKSVSRQDGSRDTHDPEELVDARKLRKISQVASIFMEEHHDTREYQIDVVAVFIDHVQRKAQCRLIEGAF